MEEYLGVIKLFAGPYAPRGYAFCAGQILAISQNTALFSLIGTFFGGDGRATFALPDLRSRVPLGAGQSPGHVAYQLGQFGGTEFVTLNINEMPVHNHQGSVTVQPSGISATVAVNAGTGGTTTNDPTNAYWGKSPSAGPTQSQDYTNQKNVTMAPDAVQVQVNGSFNVGQLTISNNGGSQPHENRQPFLALNYIICMDGTYPPRN